jgi:uncharacterized protein (DUF58 family)
MRWRVDALNGFIARILPLTRRGRVFLLAAAALLALGIVRAELAVMLWGAAFLLLGFYALAGVQLMRAAVGRRVRLDPDEVRVSLDPARVHRGAAATARVRAPFPRRRVPGVRLFAGVSLDWNGRGRESSALVDAGEARADVPLETGRRGVYALSRATIVARDLLGFCAASVPVAAAGMLTVMPQPIERPVGETTAVSGGEHRLHAAHRRRSEELFETRRYVPGDDPRRINWKLFARWNELLVRIGEEVPPPRSRVLCYLLTGAAPARRARQQNPAARRRRAPSAAADREDALDAAVATFAGVCRHLARRGVEVAYGFGGTARRGTVGAEHETEFLADLAGADWDGGELPAASRFAENGARPSVILVVPGETPDIAGAVRELSAQVRVVDTVVAAEPPAAPAARPPLWHALLFRRPVPAEGGAA